MNTAPLTWADDSPGGTIMLNRAALILRYKQPFVDWINAADPSPTSHTLTLAEVNQEHAVYLVEVEDEDELAEGSPVITRSSSSGSESPLEDDELEE